MNLTVFFYYYLGHLTNLQYLSLSETLVSNLWTTVDALKPLPNLRHLSFTSTDQANEEDYFEDLEQEEDRIEDNDENSLSNFSDIEDLLEDDSDSVQVSEDDSFADLTQWMQRAANNGQIYKQKYYREFIIHHLPQLDSLDRKQITSHERVQSREIVANNFILDPFKEQNKYSKKYNAQTMPYVLMDCQLGTIK